MYNRKMKLEKKIIILISMWEEKVIIYFQYVFLLSFSDREDLLYGDNTRFYFDFL